MIGNRNVFRQLDDSIYNEKSQQPRLFKKLKIPSDIVQSAWQTKTKCCEIKLKP